MACAGCAGCGGCVEPTCPGTCSVNCTGGTCKCGYTICPWPAISGSGCLPGGDCTAFANKKICLKNTAADVWKSDVYTVDCTTTYGVVVDIRWEMTLDASGNVSLTLKAYQTGTSTLLATITTYAEKIDLARCDKDFVVQYVSDGGQCSNWPGSITVVPNCCKDCPTPPGGVGQCGPYQEGTQITPCCSTASTFIGALYATFSGISSTSSDPLIVFECNTFNGTFRLDRSSAFFDSRYRYVTTGFSPDLMACCALQLDGTYLWSLSISSGNTIVPTAGAIYECLPADFNCTPSGFSTFVLRSCGGPCSGYPETIQVQIFP